jgi:hypothetical protein
MCGIYIGFSKPKDVKFPILSWMIQWVEKRPYSHTYLKWYDPWIDQYVIYEARGTTVHLISEHKFLEQCEVVKEFRLEFNDENVKKQIIRRAFDNIEAKYAIMQLVGLGIVKLFKNFGRIIANPFSSGGHSYICSEVVADILINVLHVQVEQDIDSISPSDIYKIVEKIGVAR